MDRNTAALGDVKMSAADLAASGVTGAATEASSCEGSGPRSGSGAIFMLAVTAGPPTNCTSA